jgi:hypothetical protein
MLWLAEERQLQQQIPFRDDNKKSNGVVDDRALYVPPIAKCAMDGAPVHVVAGGRETTTTPDPLQG